MASADVVEPGPVECEDEEEDIAEPEAVSYPLRVDYCGLCSMPPEVNCQGLGILSIKNYGR